MVNTVSVIIPTWNRSKTIKKAILSVLNQTHSSLEILVCDDGSTDNTREIVTRINDKRVRWIEGNHSGLPAIPRNRGIKGSKGEWIAFLDSDDEWLPEKLAKQLQAVKKNKLKAVSSNAFRFVPNKRIMGNYLSVWDKSEINITDLLNSNLVICSSVLIKNTLFDKVLGFPEKEKLKTIEDYALWLRIATQTNFAYIKEPLLIYHDDVETSIRSKVSLNACEQKKYVFNDFLKWAKKQKNSDKYIELAQKALYVIASDIPPKLVNRNKFEKIIELFKKHYKDEDSSYC